MPKLIFLMGAPSGRLRWQDDDLLDKAIPPFIEDDSDPVHDPRPHSSSYPLKWRLLQNREPLQLTSEIQPLYSSEEAHFFRIQDWAAACAEEPVSLARDNACVSAGQDPVLSQFYDHSFSIHETSQLYLSQSSHFDSMQESCLSIDDTRRSASPQFGDQLSNPRVPFPPLLGHLTGLEDIPDARYLDSIIPQTMTVNLIVGILSVEPPRRVKTRQWGRELDIVELIVGDETKSGFGVTFWLSPAAPVSAASARYGDNALRQTLADLRSRDIVLLRTIGLSSFRDRVYGQSFRGATKVDLLYRLPVHSAESTGMYSSRTINAARHDHPPLMKLHQVREWVLGHLWSGGTEGGNRMLPPSLGTLLPPDTQ
jgi:hypothetical protein